MKYFIVILSWVLLSSCSSQKNAKWVYQTDFDFSTIQSYGIFLRNSHFSDIQNLNDVMRNGIESAIERTLDNNGLFYQDISQADVIVSYYFIQDNNASERLARYNRAVFYCQRCPSAQKHDLGKDYLIIDLLAPNSRRSVWRSIYPVNIKVKDNSRIVNQKILSAIRLMLAQVKS